MFLASSLEELLPCLLAVKSAPGYPGNSRDWKKNFERLFRCNGVRPSLQLHTWFLHLCAFWPRLRQQHVFVPGTERVPTPARPCLAGSVLKGGSVVPQSVPCDPTCTSQSSLGSKLYLRVFSVLRVYSLKVYLSLFSVVESIPQGVLCS